MDRRAFLRHTSAALLFAGLPLALRDKKPKDFPFGYIREVQQYSIEDNGAPWRYDAVGVKADGEEVQFWVQLDDDPHTEARREAARWAMAHRFAKDGLTPVKPGTGNTFKLVLPRSIPAQYI